MAIARFAVTRKVAVVMLTVAIVVLGIFAAPRLAVALLPYFAPPVVTVTTAYGNAAPETIESAVTRPIENAVSRVSGVDILESTSNQGRQVSTRCGSRSGSQSCSSTCCWPRSSSRMSIRW